MKARTEKSLVQGGFWLAVLILCGVGVTAHQGTRRQVARSEETERSHKFVTNLDAVLARLDETESQARAFVITGDEAYLPPFTRARARTQEALVDLDALAARNALYQRHKDRLVLLVEKKLEALEQLIAHRRDSGFEAARTWVESNRDTSLTAEIRNSITLAKDAEATKSARYTEQVNTEAQFATALFIVGSFVSLAMLLGVFLFLNVQIDARKLAEQALAEEKRATEQAYQRQEALAEIELAINQPHELQRVLDRIVQIVTNLLPATGASVILWEEAKQEFVVSASTIPPLDNRPATARVRRTSGATRWIVDRRKPLIVADVREDPFGANSMLAESGLQAYAGVPLLVEGQAIGVLYALDRTPRDYRPQEIDFLTALAARAALAISKVQLYSKLQDINQLLEHRVDERTTELATTNKQLRELSGRLLQLQDEERRRLARDLHDVTAQNLSVVTLNLARIQQQLPAAETDAQALLTESLSLAEQCLREIRTLSYILHPPMLDEYGLVRALEWYLEGFTKRSHVQVTLAAAPDIGRFEPFAEMALFRVVQECLTNIYRHSGSQLASIELTRTDGLVNLSVQDSGGNFRTPAPERLGVGITGMRERLRQLGGRLEIESDAKGTTVRATVPLREAKT